MNTHMPTVFLIVFSFIFGNIITVKAAIPGRFPPKHIQNNVRPLLKDIRMAQSAKNEQQVLKLTENIVEHLGDWVSNPDYAPVYHFPIKVEQPSQKVIEALWEKISDKVKRNALWVKVPDGNPDKMSHGLRQAARPLIANATMYNHQKYREPETLKFIANGADYLLKLQRANGLFPTPDLRGDDVHYTSFNKRALKKNPEALIEGWFVDDYRGELQLDHAVSGLAMLKVYQITNQEKYLASAVKASEWSITKQLDTNWSYNAYSVWLLAETYQVTGRQKYLFHAIEKLKLGVLPGLLPNGRWFDPINSRLIYHATNVRAMLAVYRNLLEADPFKKQLKQRIERALTNATTEIINYGASSVTTSTEMLVDAMKTLDANSDWQTALNININAGIDSSENRGHSPIGIFLPSYLDFRLNN
ncbi:MAG: hypothetical protein KUG78_05490 [Kangiellaceae bacterium]|nr:hypothetical protein [Kangiellaceae bacterium]